MPLTGDRLLELERCTMKPKIHRDTDPDYGKHGGDGSTGLCAWCGEDAARPSSRYCRSCEEELETLAAELGIDLDR